MLCERFVVVVVVVVVVITLQPIHFRLVEKIPSSLSCSSIDHEQTYRIRSDLTGWGHTFVIISLKFLNKLLSLNSNKICSFSSIKSFSFVNWTYISLSCSGSRFERTRELRTRWLGALKTIRETEMWRSENIFLWCLNLRQISFDRLLFFYVALSQTLKGQFFRRSFFWTRSNQRLDRRWPIEG